MKTGLPILLSVTALFGAPLQVSAQVDDQYADDDRSNNHHSGNMHAEDRRAGPRHGHFGPGGFRDPARMLERMAKHLDLDETQRQNISNIVEAAKPEFEALRERARTNRTAMRELDPDDPDYSTKLNNLAIENGETVTGGTVLFGRIRAEIAAELTDEQRAQLHARLANLRERFKHGRRHSRAEANL